MLPYYMKIGNFKLPSYGLMIAIGIILGTILAYKRAYCKLKRIYPEYKGDYKQLNTKLPAPENIIDMIMVGVIAGVIGGKLLFIIPNIKAVIESGNIIEFLANGFVIYGAIIAGAAAITAYCALKKKDTLSCLDSLIPYVSLAQGFGRIGCFLVGCCYGKPTQCPIGVVFTSEYSLAPRGIKLIPTQMISSIGNFCFFVMLLIISNKAKKKGLALSAYMLLYSVGRFIIEFYRGDSIRGFIGFLSTSQFISIFIFIAGLLLTVKILKDKKYDYSLVYETGKGEVENGKLQGN